MPSLSTKIWVKILGYTGLKVRLKVGYIVPPIKEGEIGVVVSSDYYNNYLQYFLEIKFSRNRTLHTFSDEVELLE